jgi:hypothetical protein
MIDMSRPKEFLALAVKMLGPVVLSRKERLRRFAEEALELLHAEAMPLEELDRIMWRVWTRPPGGTLKEIGQAQACLETFAESIGESSDKLAQLEFERMQTVSKEEWQKRHAAKVKLGIAS